MLKYMLLAKIMLNQVSWERKGEEAREGGVVGGDKGGVEERECMRS